MMALFGTLLLLPLPLQSVLGLTTLQTGLVLLPGGLTMGLLAPFVGRVYDRVGPRPLVAPGAAVTSAASWGMTTLDAASGRPTVIALHVLMSIGLALMFTPLLTSALGALPQHLYSHGSAIVSTLQQVAGAAGTDAGASLVDATADGIHTALMYGGAISALAVLVALLVRRPPESQTATAEPVRETGDVAVSAPGSPR